MAGNAGGTRTAGDLVFEKGPQNSLRVTYCSGKPSFILLCQTRQKMSLHISVSQSRQDGLFKALFSISQKNVGKFVLMWGNRVTQTFTKLQNCFLPSSTIDFISLADMLFFLRYLHGELFAQYYIFGYLYLAFFHFLL